MSPLSVPGRSGAPTQIVFDESDESGLNFLRNTLLSEYRTTGLCSWQVKGAVTMTTCYRPCLGSYKGIVCKKVFRTKARGFCHDCGQKSVLKANRIRSRGEL
jgi:hypothetical protein